MKYLFFLIFLVLFNPFLLGQTTLAYTLEENAVFTIKQNAEQVITQELDGATHELTNTINGILEFRVLEKRDSVYDIALSFKDLNLKMNSSIQGELMNVKAQEVDEEDMQSQIFNSLLNSPVQLVLAKTGDILEVNGGDSLVSKMASASGLTDEFSLNMMKKSLEKEFGSEALSNSYEQMTFIYPSQIVQIGDQWENQYSGKLNAQNTWTLEAFSEKITNITGMAEVNMDVIEPATTMKLEGIQETQVTADTASGFIQKMMVEGFYEGVSTMAQMGDQEIPTTIQSTITYELINDFNKPINN